jgi:serine/threonine protein kinase
MVHVDPQAGPFGAGDRFFKYEIRGLLGRGGHAFVYHGYDSFLDRDVAIKIIVNPAEPGRDLQRRAQLEARMLCRLKHPNVVSVMDAGATEAGFVYIIMELLNGRTLRDVLVDLRRLTVAEALAVGAHIADGVQAAHIENAIHRDLKPENVFILEGNFAKVLDFGIAKFLGGAKTTQRDLLHGTMPYMSPEHLQGLGVTARSDIFALGAVLYEALGGRPPCLVGMQEPTMHSLAWAQINRMPPPLDELTKTVPRHVARLVQRMIAKDPVDRFATMYEVAEVLRAGLRRMEAETGEIEASRELWKASRSTGDPYSWTTKIGQPLPFGGTAVIHRRPDPTSGDITSPVFKPPFAVGSPDAASDGAEPIVGAIPAPALAPAPIVERAFAVNMTSDTVAVPITAPGLASGIGTNPGTARGLRSVTLRALIGAGLAVGVVAGVALGFLTPRHGAVNAPLPALPRATEPSLASFSAHAPPAAPSTERTPAPAPPEPTPQVNQVAADTAHRIASRTAAKASVPALVPGKVVAPATPPFPDLELPKPSKPASPTTTLLIQPHPDLPAQLPASGLPAPAPRKRAPAAPRPAYGADDIQ